MNEKESSYPEDSLLTNYSNRNPKKHQIEKASSPIKIAKTEKNGREFIERKCKGLIHDSNDDVDPINESIENSENEVIQKKKEEEKEKQQPNTLEGLRKVSNKYIEKGKKIKAKKRNEEEDVKNEGNEIEDFENSSHSNSEEKNETTQCVVETKLTFEKENNKSGEKTKEEYVDEEKRKEKEELHVVNISEESSEMYSKEILTSEPNDEEESIKYEKEKEKESESDIVSENIIESEIESISKSEEKESVGDETNISKSIKPSVEEKEEKDHESIIENEDRESSNEIPNIPETFERSDEEKEGDKVNNSVKETPKEGKEEKKVDGLFGATNSPMKLFDNTPIESLNFFGNIKIDIEKLKKSLNKNKEKNMNENKELGKSHTTIETFTDEQIIHVDSSIRIRKFIKTKEKNEWSDYLPVKLQIMKHNTLEKYRIMCFHKGTGRLYLNTDIFKGFSIKSHKNLSACFIGRDLHDETKLSQYIITLTDSYKRDNLIKVIKDIINKI